MADCRSTMDRKTPRRMRWRVILEKEFSTVLNHKAEIGVVGGRIPPFDIWGRARSYVLLAFFWQAMRTGTRG